MRLGPLLSQRERERERGQKWSWRLSRSHGEREREREREITKRRKCRIGGLELEAVTERPREREEAEMGNVELGVKFSIYT